ncbi:hypothetical protein HZB02_06705, partial [Candidatus Woesearchaeota archaeon]|nr:hypothetical protein [Candidatus Woesearchaeota archaeon]
IFDDQVNRDLDQMLASLQLCTSNRGTPDYDRTLSRLVHLCKEIQEENAQGNIHNRGWYSPLDFIFVQPYYLVAYANYILAIKQAYDQRDGKKEALSIYPRDDDEEKRLSDGKLIRSISVHELVHWDIADTVFFREYHRELLNCLQSLKQSSPLSSQIDSSQDLITMLHVPNIGIDISVLERFVVKAMSLGNEHLAGDSNMIILKETLMLNETLGISYLSEAVATTITKRLYGNCGLHHPEIQSHPLHKAFEHFVQSYDPKGLLGTVKEIINESYKLGRPVGEFLK